MKSLIFVRFFKGLTVFTQKPKTAENLGKIWEAMKNTRKRAKSHLCKNFNFGAFLYVFRAKSPRFRTF